MAHSNSMNSNRMDAILPNAMPAEATESLSEEDVMAALSMTNMQAGTDLTMEDFEAAMVLVYLSDPSTQKSESLSEEDVMAALSLTNMQAGTDLTMEDFEAAKTLVSLSDPSTQNSAAFIGKSNLYPAFKVIQANETNSQHREGQHHLIAHQRQQRVKQPKDHRKAEYQKSLAKETESHREERLP